MFKSRIFKSMLALMLVLMMVFGSVACSAKPSEKSFKSAYEKEIEGMMTKVQTYYDVLGSYDVTNMKVEANATVQISDDLLSLIEGMSGYDFAWVNDAKISMTENFKGDAMSVAYALAYKASNVVTSEMILDLASSKIFMSIPELSDLIMGYDFSEEAGSSSEMMLSMLKSLDIKKLLPKTETLKNVLLNAYAKASGEIEDVSFKEVTLDVNGVKQKCIAYEVELTEADLANIALEVLEMAKTDKDLKSLITTTVGNVSDMMDDMDMGAAIGDPEAVYEMLVEEIDGAIEMIKAAKDEMDDDDAIVEWTSYVTTKLDVIGMEITIPDADCTVFIASAKNKNNVGVEMSVKMNGTKMAELTGSLINDGKKISGDCDVKVQGQKMATINLADVDVAQLNKGLFVGSITVAPSKDASAMLEDEMGAGLSELGLSVSDLALKISVTKNTGKEFAMSFSVLNKKDVYFGISIDAKVSEGTAINVPSSSVDAETWSEDISFDALINKFEQAGLPDYLIELIGDAL